MPSRVSAASASERMGEDMRFDLVLRGWLKYGFSFARGKVLTLLIATASPAAAEPVRILAFGDSLTQGYGLPEFEGFVPQLQDWLSAQGAEVQVVNGGVSGDTSAGGAARVAWSLTEDIDAMILTLGGNDLLRGLEPDMTRANIETILTTAKDNGVAVLLVGMTAPGNFGPEYKSAFDAIYPDLAERHGTLYFESFFKGLGSEDLAELRAYFQSDGIHPNAEGVEMIVSALGPTVLELIETAGAQENGALN